MTGRSILERFVEPVVLSVVMGACWLGAMAMLAVILLGWRDVMRVFG